MGRPVAKPNYYNFATVTYAVDSLIGSDFDDGGVESSYVTADVTNSEVSADGLVHVDQNNDPRIRHTVKVKQQSFFAQYLWRKAAEQDAQANAGGGLKAMTVSLVCPTSGYSITDPDAYFITVPPQNHAKAQGSVDFVIELPNGRYVEQIGTLLTPPVRT